MTIGGRTISNAPWEIAAAGNQEVIRIAVVREPREAIPLQGTWVVAASDNLAMKVAVKVIAAAGADAGCRQRVGDGMMTPARDACSGQIGQPLGRITER
jgi:hypothetical protein